jgi:hypothetical protein
MATSETRKTTKNPDHAIPDAVCEDWHALKGRICGRKAKAARRPGGGPNRRREQRLGPRTSSPSLGAVISWDLTTGAAVKCRKRKHICPFEGVEGVFFSLVQLRCGTLDTRVNTGDLCGLCQLRSKLIKPCFRPRGEAGRVPLLLWAAVGLAHGQQLQQGHCSPGRC